MTPKKQSLRPNTRAKSQEGQDEVPRGMWTGNSTLAPASRLAPAYGCREPEQVRETVGIILFLPAAVPHPSSQTCMRTKDQDELWPRVHKAI